MDLKHIKAIIFDAEGVVVNTESLWDKSMEALLEKRGLWYDREYLKPKMVGQTLLEGAQLMVDYYGLSESAIDVATERGVLIHGLFENEINFIDGFLPFLNWLRSTGLQLSIATAMNKGLMKKVEMKLKLKEIFKTHIYFVEDVGNKSKPAPDVFLLASEKMGINPSNCLVIEDAPHGIEAANRACMISIGLTTTFASAHLKEANYIAENFGDVKKLLNGLRIEK